MCLHSFSKNPNKKKRRKKSFACSCSDWKGAAFWAPCGSCLTKPLICYPHPPQCCRQKCYPSAMDAKNCEAIGQTSSFIVFLRSDNSLKTQHESQKLNLCSPGSGYFVCSRQANGFRSFGVCLLWNRSCFVTQQRSTRIRCANNGMDTAHQTPDTASSSAYRSVFVSPWGVSWPLHTRSVQIDCILFQCAGLQMSQFAAKIAQTLPTSPISTRLFCLHGRSISTHNGLERLYMMPFVALERVIHHVNNTTISNDRQQPVCPLLHETGSSSWRCLSLGKNGGPLQHVW